MMEGIKDGIKDETRRDEDEIRDKMPGQTLPASSWSAYSWDLAELTQGTPWRADRKILASGAQTAGL